MTAQEFFSVEDKYYIYITGFFAVPLKYRIIGHWCAYKEVPMIQIEYENGEIEERNLDELMSCCKLEDCRKQCERLNIKMENYRNMWQRDVRRLKEVTGGGRSMNLFKNFKTKKQLREEIERLKAVHERPPIIKEHVEVQKLYASYLADNQILDMVESDVSEKYAQKRVAEEIAQLIIPFIEYSMEDFPEGKIYRGILSVVGRKL